MVGGRRVAGWPSITTRWGRFVAVRDSRLSYLPAFEFGLVSAKFQTPFAWTVVPRSKSTCWPCATGSVQLPTTGPSILGRFFAQVTLDSVQVLFVMVLTTPPMPPSDVLLEPTVIWRCEPMTGNWLMPVTVKRRKLTFRVGAALPTPSSAAVPK